MKKERKSSIFVLRGLIESGSRTLPFGWKEHSIEVLSRDGEGQIAWKTCWKNKEEKRYIVAIHITSNPAEDTKFLEEMVWYNTSKNKLIWLIGWSESENPF